MATFDIFGFLVIGLPMLAFWWAFVFCVIRKMIRVWDQ